MASLDDVGFAITRDFVDLAGGDHRFNLAAVDSIRFAGEPENAADFVELHLAARTERSEYIAKVDGVIGVAIEVSAGVEAGSGDAIDHGAIAQNRQIESIAVEGDELRLELVDSINDYHKRVPTRDVNRVIAEAQQKQPAGSGARVLYALQGANDPPTFTLFVNRELPQPYLRYLERCIREHFEFGSTPIKMRVRKRGD